MRVLVVTAVTEEADAVSAGLGTATSTDVGPYREARALALPWGELQVLVGGVGPAAAAAATASALAAGGPYDLVVDAGVAGGFAGRAGVGSVVLADRVVAADLGAETPAAPDGAPGFVPLDVLGFGTATFDLDAALVQRGAQRVRVAWPDTKVGTVLTVSTVTGTPASTHRLLTTHPGAMAEAMEGFGVVTAARAWNLPALELRTVCNPVGVSDRALWDLDGAFAALDAASTALLADAPALLGADR